MNATTAQNGPFAVTNTDRVLRTLHAHGTRETKNPVQKVVQRAAFAAWLTGYYATHPMGRSTPIRSGARLWAWQIWRRTVARTVRVELPGGGLLDCPAWSKMAGAWVAVGLHEPGEMLFVAATLRPGDVFVDVGANIGVYSVLALKAGASVYAFEPTPKAREALTHNLGINAAEDRFNISPNALSDAPGTMSFRVDLESSNHLVRESADGDLVKVNVSTLDASIPENVAPAIIKIDAEGFDADVLRGATRVLRENKPSVIAEIWGGGDEVRKILVEAGYGLYRYDHANGQLVSMPSDFNSDGYLIGVHDSRIETVRARLAERHTAAGSSKVSVKWFLNASQ